MPASLGLGACEAFGTFAGFDMMWVIMVGLGSREDVLVPFPTTSSQRCDNLQKLTSFA